ncbi:ABC transporter substrate-binding protein [Sinomonas sp. G460-2]|uniref:ABC transporter substrate-binding protein n=1 Tax=Sinomonas sp. G460-2 TaxID=3393464 RepID=UPI0039F05406
MYTRTTLRAALGVALTLVLASTATACGTGSSASGDGKTHLRFAWWGDTKRAEATSKAIAAFEAANPDIVVQGEPSDFKGYFDKLATSVAAKDAPDVFTLGGAYPAEYANRGALLDLGTIGSQLDLSHLNPSELQNGQVKGKQYGVSTGANALGVVANPAVFAAAGIPLPDDSTWTWDDYARIGAELTAKSPKGTYGIATSMTHDSLDAFARQRGQSLYTKDGALGLDATTIEAFFSDTLTMNKSSATPSPAEQSEQLNASTEQTLMGLGKAGMTLTWSNSLSALSTAAKSNLVLLHLPGENPTHGIWLQSSQFYSISARTKNTEAAAKLVNFLVNNATAAPILGTDRGVPGNPSMRAAISPQLSQQGKTEVAYIDSVGKMSFAPTYIGPTGSTKVSEITARATSDVLFGRLSPHDAAARWMTESKQAIAH